VELKKIYFIPFAGGSKYSYNDLLAFFPKEIECTVLELPGRGNRFRERLLYDIEEMVDDLLSCREFVPDKPYMIFGHSMGALLGYLLVKKLVKNNLLLPADLFFSSCPAPSAIRNSQYHELPEDELIVHLTSLGGISLPLIDNKELLKIFVPIIRADLHAISSYKFVETCPFNIPITVISGSEESISSHEIDGWRLETTASFETYELRGQHFFIFNDPAELAFRILEKRRLINIG
jgi:surfactin synthase thioesterase subunit